MDVTKVDPAALLIAVAAVAFTAMTGEGAWDPINTWVAGVVLVIMWAYLWPTYKPEPRRLAVGTVLAAALVGGVALAWPGQWLVTATTNRARKDRTLADWTRIPIVEDWTAVEVGYVVGQVAALVLAWALVYPRLMNLPDVGSKATAPCGQMEPGDAHKQIPGAAAAPAGSSRKWVRRCLTCTTRPSRSRQLLAGVVLLGAARRWLRLR